MQSLMRTKTGQDDDIFASQKEQIILWVNSAKYETVLSSLRLNQGLCIIFLMNSKSKSQAPKEVFLHESSPERINSHNLLSIIIPSTYIRFCERLGSLSVTKGVRLPKKRKKVVPPPPSPPLPILIMNAIA